MTVDDLWIHHYDPFSQLEAKVWKRSGQQTPTRLHQERSTGKAMMIIFWDKDVVLLTKYLPRETTIDPPDYASIIERLRSVILEKRRGKASHKVLLLHDNAPIHKCNIVQTVIRKIGFVELNRPAYSPAIALFDYYLFSSLKKFLHSKNFSLDDETVDTVEDYLNNFDSEFFL